MAGTGTAHLRHDVVLSVTELVVEFPARKKQVVHAVSGVSFDLDKGETLGIVGESGCGKTTTGRAIMQLESVTSGSIRLNGVDLAAEQGEQLRQARKAMQMIFQDPVSSLNPSRRVREIVREGIDIWGSTRDGDLDTWVAGVMESVGLGDEGVADRRPHEFSGGQRQRIAIARALAPEPKLIIADEPVSALDVSIQSQILNLLLKLRKELNLTMMFISHDLSVVRYISDNIAVMHHGKIVEYGDAEDVFNKAQHPYTQKLIEAIPHIKNIA